MECYLESEEAVFTEQLQEVHYILNKFLLAYFFLEFHELFYVFCHGDHGIVVLLLIWVEDLQGWLLKRLFKISEYTLRNISLLFQNI